MRNKMKCTLRSSYMTLFPLFVVGILTLFFSINASARQPDFVLQTSSVVKPTVRLIETSTIQYVDRPATTVERIERVEKVYMELRNYKDLEELKQWLVMVNTNSTTIYFQQPDVTADCDDFALMLQWKALADGYMMSFQIIEPNRYNSLFQSGKMPPNTLHAINLVVIGNNAYYIEPQTGEIVFAAQLD